MAADHDRLICDEDCAVAVRPVGVDGAVLSIWYSTCNSGAEPSWASKARATRLPLPLVADEVGRSSYPWNGRRAPPPPVTKPVASGGGRHDRGARGDCHDTVVLPTEYARIESPEHRPEAAGDAMGLLPAA